MWNAGLTNTLANLILDRHSNVDQYTGTIIKFELANLILTADVMFVFQLARFQELLV